MIRDLFVFRIRLNVHKNNTKHIINNESVTPSWRPSKPMISWKESMVLLLTPLQDQQALLLNQAIVPRLNKLPLRLSPGQWDDCVAYRSSLFHLSFSCRLFL